MVKIGSKFITINGKRVGVRYDAGPWVEGVDPATIKIRPRVLARFPETFRSIFEVENSSDVMTDYFERDSIRVLPGHPLYEQVKQAAA